MEIRLNQINLPSLEIRMNRFARFFLYLTLVGFMTTLGLFAPSIVSAQAPTNTSTPTATQASGNYSRPLVVMNYYETAGGPIQAGEDFDLYVQVHNTGQRWAYNVQITFSANSDLVLRSTGGVIVIGDIAPGNHAVVTQPFTARSSLWGTSLTTQEATISYADQDGTVYSEHFTMGLSVVAPVPGRISATATPAIAKRPQLIISSYQVDIAALQPGTEFTLSLNVTNVGSAPAKRITLIVGGGSVGSSGGTAQPGGVSGGSGEFTNFAPLGTSNIQSLGDLAPSQSLEPKQPLIVNVTTNPGAYPVKITFAYLDDKGNTFNDDQVITLLVYNLPRVDIGFYRDPGSFYAGQPNVLPIQIVNLGRQMNVFGNMRVSASGATFENGQILIGPLEGGGYFTLDATMIPDAAGPMTLTITVDYTDDFNQPRTITRELQIEVGEGGEVIGPDSNGGIVDGKGGGGGGEVAMPVEETFWQKVWRFVLGIFGLDSGSPSTQPEKGIPTPAPGVVPISPGKG
jgi:hypothetical protein